MLPMLGSTSRIVMLSVRIGCAFVARKRRTIHLVLARCEIEAIEKQVTELQVNAKEQPEGYDAGGRK